MTSVGETSVRCRTRNTYKDYGRVRYGSEKGTLRYMEDGRALNFRIFLKVQDGYGRGLIFKSQVFEVFSDFFFQTMKIKKNM